MTTNKDSNSGGAPHRINGAEGEQAHERREAGRYREGEELDPRNTQGNGTKRTRAQGRGNDPDLD